MTYLIDTDWVADYLDGKSQAVKFLNSLLAENIFISIITYGEIYEGIYFGRDPMAAERGFERFLDGAHVIPLDRQIMQRFAQIRGQLRRRGLLIRDPDLLIAATAIHHDLTLVTRNNRHFERIAGLHLYETPEI